MSEEKFKSSFAWQDEISALQRGLLKISTVAGVVLAFGGIQLSVRGYDYGSWIAAFGMFIAAEMRWGVQGMYNFLEEHKPGWLERFGYARFFWVLFALALAVNCVGLIGIIFFVTDYMSTGELPWSSLLP